MHVQSCLRLQKMQLLLRYAWTMFNLRTLTFNVCVTNACAEQGQAEGAAEALYNASAENKTKLTVSDVPSALRAELAILLATKQVSSEKLWASDSEGSSSGSLAIKLFEGLFKKGEFINDRTRSAYAHALSKRANLWMAEKSWDLALKDLTMILIVTQFMTPAFGLRVMEQRCEVAWQVGLT